MVEITREKFEVAKKDFKEKYDIDLTYEAFEKIVNDEARAKEVQKEAEGVSGSGSTCEESNAKCINCSAGLSYLEHSTYGNRCLFCAADKAGDYLVNRTNVFVFLVRSICDFIIYHKLIRILFNKGPEGRIYLCGCLGYLGFRDINQVKHISDKLDLIRELNGIIKSCAR
jgi:hypothetical protein